MPGFARDLKADDIDECVHLAMDRPLFCEQLNRLGSRMDHGNHWRQLLRRLAICGGVAEDPDGAAGHRLFVFGMGAFVRPTWLSHFLDDPFPFLGTYILGELYAGREDILLSDAEVREANSGSGLSAVVLVSGWPYSREAAPFEVKVSAASAFTHCYRGYRMNEFVTEGARGPETDFMLSNSTWRERKRFALSAREGTTRRELVLLGITAREVREPGQENSLLSPLFLRPVVRFFFTPPQQDLLMLASSVMSDKEMAGRLNIGPDAIGRRFERIYRRVYALQHPNDPVFGERADHFAKRRLLLNYLSKNMHELRPHNVTVSKGRQEASKHFLASES